MWKPLELGSDYGDEFEAAIEAIHARDKLLGIDYSSHWPLETRLPGIAPSKRVLVVGKATNGFAQLHPCSATASAAFAREAGRDFDPWPGGTYSGGFWNFLVGTTGIFRESDMHRISLVWSNLYKVGRGFNHVTAGRPPWLGRRGDQTLQRSYTPRNPAPDGGIDNNPTAAERTAQGRTRMLRMLRQEIEICSPDLVVCVCRPWLAEAVRGGDWQMEITGDPRSGPTLDFDFLGTGAVAVVGRHPIRIPGGLNAYASEVRETLSRAGIWRFGGPSERAA